MSDPMLVIAFLVIVLAPCLIALDSWVGDDCDTTDESCLNKWREMHRMGQIPEPLQAMLPEAAIAKDFEIRSFPKGLSQRRLVVRDTESGPKLTIGQLREAAVELIKLGGLAVVHELALVAATMVAAGKSLAAAAREVMYAALHADAWQAWSQTAIPASGVSGAWDIGPPQFRPARVAELWSEESQAA